MPLANPVMRARINAVLIGKAVDFTRPGSRSAISKQPLAARVAVTTLGLYGDEQGDRRVHGGADKAIHHYPFDHYTAWREELGEHALLAVPGAFGENISTIGVTERDLCLGDRLALGTAVVQVTQLRQPCWKLSDHFAIVDMARRVQESGRTGWYYRVLQSGHAQAGDELVLLERRFPHWPLSRLVEVLYRRQSTPEMLQEILSLPLVPSWRALFERRLALGQIENWDKQLCGDQG